jgi:hypothetical protein
MRKLRDTTDFDRQLPQRTLKMRSPLHMQKAERPGVAWYDVKGRGPFRDIAVILHPPYTLWHLSYVPLGAALAPHLNWAVLGWTYLAFFLGMGIGGHCLDELNRRPLRTTLPGWVLAYSAVISVAAAVGIGAGVVTATGRIWLIPCLVFGVFIVLAYNQEWPTHGMRKFLFSALPVGFFHRDVWFGIAWGAFPAITAYVAQTGTISLAAVLIAGYAFAASMAQRKLSLQARFWRRKVATINGSYTIRKPDNTYVWENIGLLTIIGPPELTLKYLNVAVIAVSIGVLLIHLFEGGL